jgi:hypothetical protein
VSQEVNAARAMIYGRLSGDATITVAVGTNIFTDRAVQGTSGNFITYELLEAEDEKAHAGQLWVAMKFRVAAWGQTRDYSTISSIADRVLTLLDASSGSYLAHTVYAVRLAPHEERVPLKGGGMLLGVGHDFLVIAQTGSNAHSSQSYFAYGTAASEVNVSAYCDRIELVMAARKHRQTRVDETAEQSEPLELVTYFVLWGKWSETADNAFRSLIRTEGKSAIWGPGGSSSGKRKYSSSSCWLGDYRHISPEQGPVRFRAVIYVSGSLTQGTF